MEDRRGQPIGQGLSERSWLYLNDNAVKCNRGMEVAAMVSAINPHVTANCISIEMAALQQVDLN